VNWKKWGTIVSLLLVFWVWQQWPDAKLRVVFCDVGQGDGAIVTLGSFQAVIDTGAFENKMVECLSQAMPFWDRQIEIVFLSHADNDHVGAFAGLKKRYRIEKVVASPRPKEVIRYGSLYFDILKGSEPVVDRVMKGGSESNESSVVMRVSLGSFSVLFTGDIDTESELALVDMGVLKKSTVLKVSHHGSKYGSAKEFLEVIKPAWAVISVGAKNNYGHPSSDTLIRLDMVGAKVLRTDKMGKISFRTDGRTVEVFREK
jgi:competence protein ComEC